MGMPLGPRQFSLAGLLAYVTLLSAGLGSVAVGRQLLSNYAAESQALGSLGIGILLDFEGRLLVGATAGGLIGELLVGRRARLPGAAIGGCLAFIAMCVVPLFC